MSNNELTLAAEFPTPGRDDWLKLVEKVLDGSTFDRKLVTTTRDGLRIEPLYSAEWPDPVAADVAGRPGAAPFVRGSNAAGSVANGWDVRQRHAGSDLGALNSAILTDLERGVTSIELGPGGISTVDQLDAALAGVHLHLARLALDWGPDAASGVALLTALWTRRGTPAEQARADLGVDPLGALAASGWLHQDVERELAALGEMAALNAQRWPKARTVRVDGTVYSNAGAPDALELAAALATGVAYLRAMTTAGLDIDQALAQTVFRLSANADQFATMAKLRAARRCWARVAQACGASDPTAGAMVTEAVTSAAMYTRRDPWVNLLRATLACFAAASAGADTVTVLPLGAADGQWDEAGLRLARNTQLILAEEVGAGRVIDPAGGSWYLESRTEALAHAAWQLFQDIEAAGGMTAVLLDGSLAGQIDAHWQSRRADLARRKEIVIGVSEFPDLDEATREVGPRRGAGSDGVAGPDGVGGPPGAPVRIEPLRMRRPAEPFEALRDRADQLADSSAGRPSVFVASLGALATNAARATFAKNFFEVGGIRVLPNDGFEDPVAVADAFRTSGTNRAVICSSDAVYAELAEPTASALKAAGCETVYLAGNPGDRRGAYQAAGVDEFIYVGCDLLDILGRALA